MRFEYKATAGWNVAGTPNVTSMTINGRAYASDEFVTLDETFPSYDEARAMFVPRNVVITTTTGSAAFQIDLGACDQYIDTLGEPLTQETDNYWTGSANEQPGVYFAVGCGSCFGHLKGVAYCP